MFIEGNNALSTFGTAFRSDSLQEVEKAIIIYNNEAVTTLGASFPTIVEIGTDPDGQRENPNNVCTRIGGTLTTCFLSLHIQGNAELTTLGTAFGSLRRMYGAILIQNNPRLSDFDALRNLECHNGIYQNDPSTNCENCPNWLINLPGCPNPTGVHSGSLTLSGRNGAQPMQNASVLGSFLLDSLVTITGVLRMHSSDRVVLPVFQNLEVIEGTAPHYPSLTIYGGFGASLGAVFPNIVRIGVGALWYGVPDSQTGRAPQQAFDPRYAHSDSLSISSNPALTTLGGDRVRRTSSN